MNKKLALSAVILSTALLSTAAMAHGRDRDRDGWHDHRHGRHGWRPAPPHVVYVPPRPVVIRPPVAYYPPAYYPQPVYAAPPVRYAPAPVYYYEDRVAGQVVGAVVGAVVGGVVGGELAR